MYDLRMAWRNVMGRPVQTLATVLVVGLAIALSVTTAQLNDGLQRGIIRASDPFGVLVVGAKGSAQQLVLSTLLLQGAPVGNIPISVYTDLAADSRVALAVPIAMGDNVGGARIIGTDQTFFQLRPSQREPLSFQLAQGRLFQANFEAVLGSAAAAELGLALGDRFVPSHGVTLGLGEDTHDLEHTVVGLLAPSHSPFDNAVFATYQSVLHVHEGEQDGEQDGEEVAREGEIPDEQITAILVKPTGFVETNQIWQEFYTGTQAQAAFPGRELGRLFDLLDQGRGILQIVGYLTAVMAGLTLFLAVYSATSAREHLLAIMRGLGAGRGTVFRVVMYEAVTVALLGAAAGRLAGLAAAWLIADRLSSQSAIPISLRYLPGLEPFLWLLPLLLGMMAGLLPAWQAYRVNVVDKLFPG